MVRYQIDKTSPKPLGNRHPSLTPFQAFKAKDDYFVIAVGNDNLWAKLCYALDKENLINDERFKSNDLRKQNIDDLLKELSPLFALKTTGEWIDIISTAGVPCSYINNIDTIMQDKQLQARNMFIPMGDFKLAGNPIKMSELPERTSYPLPPDIGQDNKDILTALGYDMKEITDLKEEGVI